MEISGKIIGLLTQQTGKSANGEWRKQEYILETEAQYPKKICFMVWGDKIDQFGIKIGERLTVSDRFRKQRIQQPMVYRC